MMSKMLILRHSYSNDLLLLTRTIVQRVMQVCDIGVQ
jgi:hypothetical protein